jgi:hypothetical protein
VLPSFCSSVCHSNTYEQSQQIFQEILKFGVSTFLEVSTATFDFTSYAPLFSPVSSIFNFNKIDEVNTYLTFYHNFDETFKLNKENSRNSVIGKHASGMG